MTDMRYLVAEDRWVVVECTPSAHTRCLGGRRASVGRFPRSPASRDLEFETLALVPNLHHH